jgi:polyhydroxybutyrate depolymerase
VNKHTARLACWGLATVVGIGWSGPNSAQMPHAAGLYAESVRVGALDRTFTAYVPPSVEPAPAVVLVLHGGSGGSGSRIRGFIGAELEAFAERHGFLVAYPDGYRGAWNDCRIEAPYEAKRENIDDVLFLEALVDRLARGFGASRKRVYAIGYSNGGHLALRLVLERPDSVRAVAAFGANLPAPEALDCEESGRPRPVLLVNGTADAINPFQGGDGMLPDGTGLGRVRSAQASLEYFGRLAGHAGKAKRLHTPCEGRSPQVEARGWNGPDRAAAVLYIVHGGGHNIPSPTAEFPAFLGPVERECSGVAAALAFFGLIDTGPYER